MAHLHRPGLTLRSRHPRATSSSRQKGSTVKKVRKNYSPQEKVSILRSHLVDKVSALQLCAEFQLQPKIFYRWLKQLFDNGAAALKRRPTIGKRPDASQHGSVDLQEQLRTGRIQRRRTELDDLIVAGVFRQRTGQACYQ